MPTRRSFARIAPLALVVALLGNPGRTAASNLLDLPHDEDRNPRITGVWFITYVHEDVFEDDDGSSGSPDFSRFEIQRGYLTYRTPITSSLRARITSDISVDQEGDGSGDIELRLKYGYIELDTGRLGPLHAGRVRAGVLQTPWISFEQELNDFRVQGPMFLNRASVFISADYGVGYFADLGAPMSEEFRATIDRRHAGRWGSIAVGIYNGGGYDEVEQNESVVPQVRLSIRLLPDSLPGLQVTTGFATGRGNTLEAPRYRSLVVMLSHEARAGVFTLTGYDGRGDLLGNEVDKNGESLDQKGGSVFGELRFLQDFSALGRFDLFRREARTGDLDTERWLVGLAWRCIPGGQLLLDYENQKALGEPMSVRNEQVKLGLEVRF